MRTIALPEWALPWLVRLLWIAVLVVGGEAIDGSVHGRSDAMSAVARYGGFGAWLIGVASLAIPAVTTLTTIRLVAPLTLPTAILTWFTGADQRDAAIFVGLATVGTVAVASAEFGRRFVQASAYGEEDRYLLRPPAAYLVAAILAWAIWAAME